MKPSALRTPRRVYSGGRHRGVTLALALVALLACAHRPPAAADPPFFRANAGTGAALHVLGSVHLGPEGGIALPALVEQRFREAAVIAVELDVRELPMSAVAESLARHGQLPPGDTLEDRLPPDLWAAMGERLADLDLEPARVETWRPWRVAFQLVTLEQAARGLEATGGVDRLLLARVGADQRVVPLETFDGQLAVMASFPWDVEVRILRDAVEGSERADVEAIYAAWRSGDDAHLEALIFEHAGDAELAPFYEAVYFRRNRQMVERLTPLLALGEPVFVVVGAGHVVGGRGIPALLAERGLHVERLRGSE